MLFFMLFDVLDVLDIKYIFYAIGIRQYYAIDGGSGIRRYVSLRGGIWRRGNARDAGLSASLCRFGMHCR